MRHQLLESVGVIRVKTATRVLRLVHTFISFFRVLRIMKVMRLMSSRFGVECDDSIVVQAVVAAVVSVAKEAGVVGVLPETVSYGASWPQRSGSGLVGHQ